MKSTLTGLARSAVALAVVVLLAPGLALVAADEIEDDHALSLEFQTTHTKWAQPYALGKTRVLYFSSGLDTDPRHVIELMQRFDVVADAVFWPHPEVDKDLHGGQRGHQRLLRLLQEKVDVFIFNKIPPTRLSSEEQYKLLRAVTEGAGLVLIGCRDDRVFLPTGKLAETTPSLGGAVPASAYQIKKGRGVLLAEYPKSPYRVGWETSYDYWQEQFGRAVLWAAGKNPQTRFRVSVEPQAITRDEGQTAKVKVEWTGARADGKLSVTVLVRREDGTVFPLKSQSGLDVQGAFECPLPPLRAGAYHVDVRTRSDRGVEGWSAAPFTVQTSNRLELKLERNWCEENETLAGEVSLNTMGVGGNSVVVNLRDRRDRILKQVILKPDRLSAHFRFSIAPWMPMLLRVEAVLLQGKAEVLAVDQYVRVTKRNRGQWNFLMWDYPRGSLSPYGEESMANLGTSLQLSWGTPPVEAAAYDIAWVPYTTWIGNTKDANGVMTPTCWNNEMEIAKVVDDVVKVHPASRQHGVFVYSLGDEIMTRGACVHPACLEAYRKYLKQEYGSINALNASWGTACKDFSEVTLSSSTDSDEGEALRSNHYPRWFDRQAFHSYNFVNYATRYRDSFRQLDPQARTGFEGAGGFGDDLDLIIRTLTFWSPYPGPGDEVVRSLAPRDFPRANWMGYTKDATSLLRVFWRMVTRGMDSVWWWRWDCLGPFNGFLAPHLGPWPATKEMVEDTKVVRDGLGTLLINSQMVDQGIALYYSYPSYYANRIGDGPSFGDYTVAHTAWFSAIRELGLQFHHVSNRMLRLGEWKSAQDKALVLPQAEAIGPAEAKVMGDFVRAGGTLIADVRPGLYDGHCKPLDKGVLGGLFGVTRKPSASAVMAPAKIAGTLANQSVNFEGVSLKCDPSVVVAGGTALGSAQDAPLCIVNKVGKGQTILLNFSMTNYPALGASQTPEAAADLMRAILASAGVAPTVEARDQKGQRFRNLETVRWRNGSTDLIALFRETGAQEEARIKLPSPCYVYDLRQRRSLGRQREFTTTIIPSRAIFFALTPSSVQGARLAVSPSRAHQGDIVSVKLQVPKAEGLYAVKLSAVAPSGKEVEWFSPVVMVGRQEVETPFPIAVNDPKGTWAVRATELFTNATTQVQVAVR